MGLVYPDLPTVGSPNSTEQPKVRQSLIDLRDTIKDATAADNLASNAVTLAKMSDNSVDTPELVDGAVTTAKIEDLAVTPGKLSATLGTANLKVGTYNAPSTLSAGSGSDRVFVSVGSVLPGYYMAVGHISSDVNAVNLRFTSSGGTASIYNDTLTGASTAQVASAILIVTATTTIRLSGECAVATYGSFNIFGIAT